MECDLDVTSEHHINLWFLGWKTGRLDLVQPSA